MGKSASWPALSSRRDAASPWLSTYRRRPLPTIGCVLDLFPEPQQTRTTDLDMSEPAVHALTELSSPELRVARRNVN